MLALMDLTPQPPLQLRGYAARGEGEPERASFLAPPLHAAKRSWRGGRGVRSAKTAQVYKDYPNWLQAIEHYFK